MKYKCQICKEIKMVKSVKNVFVCKKCFEKICLYNAASEGFRWWMESLVNNDAYQSTIDKVIIEKIEKDK